MLLEFAETCSKKSSDATKNFLLNAPRNLNYSSRLSIYNTGQRLAENYPQLVSQSKLPAAGISGWHRRAALGCYKINIKRT